MRQRLKLASVSPKLHEVYAEGDMTLDQLMAFTVNDDHARQEVLWDQLPGRCLCAACLRTDIESRVSPRALSNRWCSGPIPAVFRRELAGGEWQYVGIGSLEIGCGKLVMRFDRRGMSCKPCSLEFHFAAILILEEIPRRDFRFVGHWIFP